MENSQFETLKPSQTHFTFPPHRRRPLRSQTFSTLVRILTHCYDHSQSSHPLQAVPEEPKLDNCGIELGPVTGRDELVGHNQTESDNLLVQKEELVEETREGTGSQGEGFSNAQIEIDGLDHINILGGNEELAQDNSSNLVNPIGDNNQKHSDGVVALIDNQEDHFIFPEFPMEESGPKGSLEVDKELCVRKVCEGIDPSLDIDMIIGSSKPNENKEEKSSPLKSTVGEMQYEVKELEKTLSSSGAMSSLHQSTEEEFEDGEISGDPVVYSELMDFLLEDDTSLEEKMVDNVQISEVSIDKEVFTGNEHQRVFEKCFKSTPLIVDRVDNVGNNMEVELGVNKRKLVQYESELLFPRKIIEDKRADEYDCRLEAGRNKKQVSRAMESDSPAACPENLALQGGSSGGNATENQVTASTKKDACVRNKKKKRGPMTEEKKAKKKRKERIKRAEKNRRLGVKRLKLQPVLKPKMVTYCRHYLKGRCHEGDKCKFSHDTTPLTKSKPCCHFARQSCMKGDDCPFDHQLSKYPCNNYQSNGYCTRGADCMFSHEIPVKEGSPNVSKPELKSVSLIGNSDSNQNVNGTSRQNINAKSCSIGISACKSTEHNVAKTIPKPTAQPPKGMSFLLQGNSSQGDTIKHKQAGLLPKVDNGVKFGHPMIQSAPDLVRNSNEITKRTPQGINFLSFGKAPLNNSSSKKSFSFPFSRDQVIGKSPLSDSSKGEQAGSSTKRDDGVKVNTQTGQSALGMVQNLNEMVTTTPPAVAHRGINSLSFGKAQLDDSSNEKQPNFRSGVDNAIPPSVQEREIAPNKLQIPNVIPWRLLPSSSLPCDLAYEKSKSTPIFSQKSLLPNTPSSVQKALRSTLAFAAKFESEVKMDRSIGGPDFSKEAGSSQNKSMNASPIFDFLYGD